MIRPSVKWVLMWPDLKKKSFLTFFFLEWPGFEPMHRLYMHHGLALLSGCTSCSAKLVWQKEITKPCKVLLPTHDAFHFYIGSQFGWQFVIYSRSVEMSSNLTRFKKKQTFLTIFFLEWPGFEPMHRLYIHQSVALLSGCANWSARLGRQKESSYFVIEGWVNHTFVNVIFQANISITFKRLIIIISNMAEFF